MADPTEEALDALARAAAKEERPLDGMSKVIVDQINRDLGR
jgi:hypothetical protein